MKPEDLYLYYSSIGGVEYVHTYWNILKISVKKENKTEQQIREEREEKILSYLQNGPKQIADFVPDMYEKYDKIFCYPAAGSVHAHLLHMVETGRARVVDEPSDPKLTATYELL